MKTKFKLVIFCALVACGALISSNIGSQSNPISGFVLENAEALGSECGEGKSSGSPLSGTCNTPMTSNGKNPCSTSIITCQGSTNCCEPKSCSLH